MSLSYTSIEPMLASLPNKEYIKLEITALIASIDTLINCQLNKVMHHASFQQLESSWRGLNYLVSHVASYPKVKIRILTVSLQELKRDIESSLEFDQSQIFKQVYSYEFDHPGGEPFGLLLGDYYATHERTKNNRIGVDILTEMAKVAAAAFSPFITAASPEIFDLDKFTDLQCTVNLSTNFFQHNFAHWKALRAEEDARFLGMLLPRVLIRLPYNRKDVYVDSFCFTEEVSENESYLWGNPVYHFAANVARAFSSYGWYTDIKGVERNQETRGLVTGLPQQTYFSGCFDINSKPAIETCVGLYQEKELSDLGFIALCDCKLTPNAAFYSCQSVHDPLTYQKKIATTNSKLSVQLDYILCVSRFAHYVKIMMRDKIGTYNSPEECEGYLQQWLLNHTAAIDEMTPENKAKYPLREAKVKVKELAGKPKSYQCIIHLRPHFQADSLESSLRLVTNIAV